MENLNYLKSKLNIPFFGILFLFISPILIILFFIIFYAIFQSPYILTYGSLILFLGILLIVYFVKDVFDKLFKVVELTDKEIKLEKFFSKNKYAIKYSDIAHIQLTWDNFFRFVIVGNVDSGSNSIFNMNTHDNRIRNKGGLNLLIRHHNGAELKIYQKQFVNFDEMVEKIINELNRIQA